MRDRDVRQAVRIKLEADHAGDLNTKIVEEMGIWSGSVRIDVAVINGELSGFELKSARDTLSRLPQQTKFYNDVFDRMTIVTAENHLSGCLQIVPEWWGITVASGRPDSPVELFPIRSCERNASPSAVQIARLLWRQEALAVLSRHNLISGFKTKPADALHRRLADSLSIEILQDEVRAHLKARLGWLG